MLKCVSKELLSQTEEELFGVSRRTLLPDRQGEISHVFFTGSSQKAAVDATGFQHVFGLEACNLSVEPPANIHRHKNKKILHEDCITHIYFKQTNRNTRLHTHVTTWYYIFQTFTGLFLNIKLYESFELLNFLEV